ncbi:MAG: hypothetical protein RR603_03335 [Kurthia sp.]
MVKLSLDPRIENDKELRKVLDKFRSSVAGPKTLKVMYVGIRYGGFHYGKVIEAKPSHGRRSNGNYPFPKYQREGWKIADEDGDPYTISRDGETFERDWVVVPDEYEIGTVLLTD